MTAYVGQTIRLAFALFTDQALQRPGPYIDEVGVAEVGILP